MTTVTVETFVKASLKFAYRAFTNSTSLREWLCDAATVKANPTIRSMLDLLRRTVEEVLAFTELIPEEFTANKGSYHRFGSILLQPDFHLSAHTQQIRDALAAAGK